MNQSRPDPDALLVRVQQQQAREARGKLKIFLGAAAGVGKTYTMLEAAREQARDGVDVVIGYIEPHARPETQALVLGLDVLARREVPYRGAKLLEFDLDGALARRPQLILVDELAHTNAPGMTYAKRWQDVMRLLEAGISVYTTLNVQHLESLNDVVAQITGVAVAETVPDAIFDNADEVELVDLPPDNLIERLREGKIYVPHQAERAIKSFFSKGNLIALRELALRKAADRVGDQMLNYREEHGVSGVWPVTERLLVCVGPSPFSARLVRATRRMAASLKAPWVAVHVETPGDARMTPADRERLAQTMQLTEQLGGSTATLSGDNRADELVHFARSHNVTKIIVGKSQQPRWREWLTGSLVYQLSRKCGDVDVYIISGKTDRPPADRATTAVDSRRGGGYLWSVAAVAITSLVCWPVSEWLAPANLVMIYLLGVVAVATRFGRGPSILASLLSVAAFDFIFVPPYFTFAIEDTEYLFTFGVMLLTAVTISTLTARVHFQADSARSRERRTASLYAISHQLASARTREQIAQAAQRSIKDALDIKSVVLLADADRQIAAVATEAGQFEPAPHDRAVAQWVFEHQKLAGWGTDTLPGSEGTYLPLEATQGPVGVLGVLAREFWTSIEPERLHLLEAFARLIAQAVERVELAAEAARIRVLMETERLRSSLLSAVSHDLRTPLSIITGNASTLLDEDTPPGVRRELLESILEEGDRLNRLVANLLDMTRLDAGAIEVRKEWQSVDEIIGAALARAARPLERHELNVNVQADLPFVPMDDLLIEQVLVNLLDNAAKWAPAGSTVELAARAEGGLLLLEVSDRGPGVPPNDLQRVFEKFYRAPNAPPGSGAGLGLAICRGIVELHGGTIVAENRADGGARFRVSLPLASSQPQLPAAEAPLATPAAGGSASGD